MLVHAYYNQVLKPFTLKGTDGRQYLRDAQLFVVFVGSPPVDAHAPEDEAPAAKELLFHIGYHTFSPYRSAWQAVRWADAPMGEPAAGEDRVYFQE